MTMTPGEIERTVRQLDNDVRKIYALLHGISATQIRHGDPDVPSRSPER